jgi:hypothetical protein
MNNNSTFIRWPLNHISARTVGPQNVGILTGVRPTPPQYGGDNNVNARHEFLRVGQAQPNVKWTPPGSSSDVIAAKKRAAVGKGTYYSSTNEYSTKRHSANDARQHLRRMRSSGYVAP